MRTNFYVYMYYDSNTGLPYYVGKGTGRRDIQHIATAKRNPKYPVHRKIAKLLSEGKPVTHTRVVDNVSENTAFEIEQSLISTYGFRKNGGLLLNLAEGGSGARYLDKKVTKTSDTKQKHSDRMKSFVKNNPDFMKNLWKQKWESPNADKEIWYYADKFHMLYEIGFGNTVCQKILPRKCGSVQHMFSFFREGYRPADDVSYLNFKETSPKPNFNLDFSKLSPRHTSGFSVKDLLLFDELFNKGLPLGEINLKLESSKSAISLFRKYKQGYRLTEDVKVLKYFELLGGDNGSA